MAASFALCPNRSGRERPAKVDTFVPPDFDDRANEIIASCPRALTCVLLIQINRMRIERTFLLVVPRSPPPPAARWELSLKVPIACWRPLRQILFLRLGDPSDVDRGEEFSPLHSWRIRRRPVSHPSKRSLFAGHENSSRAILSAYVPLRRPAGDFR